MAALFKGLRSEHPVCLLYFWVIVKLEWKFPQARHIMCAYNAANIIDSCNNGEFHGGLQISRALSEAGKSNVALYITGHTGPELLEAKRFQHIRTLTAELLQILDNSTAKHPINIYLGKRWLHQPHPPPDTSSYSTSSTQHFNNSTPGCGRKHGTVSSLNFL